MIYLDTSVAVALLVPEPRSAEARRWFLDLASPLVASDWLVTEFASALAMKARLGELKDAQAARIRALFEDFLGGLRVATIGRQTFREAARLVAARGYTLRAGDALHLASALEVGATAIATFDARLGAAARAVGLEPNPRLT